MPEDKPVSTTTDDEATKREQARRALEGADWTAKRETTEHAKTVQEQISAIEKQLEEIRRQKEKLELAWIDLDEQKKAVRTVLNPILDEEKKLETDEAQIETEEASSGVPESKHAAEIKRWPIQEKRKEVEQKKWQEEEKIIAVDKTVELNTKHYRELLETEDKLVADLDKLKLELPNGQQ